MFILFGAAGSGKSLQGQRLASKYDWDWFSIGQLLRNQHNPELEKTMKTGDLVDDNFVVQLMHGEMNAAAEKNRNAILDGYPRNRWQAKWIVESGDIAKIDGAIILRVGYDELWNRLEARGRADDLSRDAVEKRWGIFKDEIEEMKQILGAGGVRFAEVDGKGSIEEVTERIEGVLSGWGIIE